MSLCLSHRNGNGRGIALFVGDVSTDDNRIGEDFAPDALESRTWENWTLPEGVVDEDGDGLVDILVRNTNGCHIYSIEVGENPELRSVGYLYDGDLNADLGYGIISADYNYEVTPIKADKAPTLEQLDQFDVVVLSSTVSNETAIAALKELRPFIPLLNLNAAVYGMWACGTTVDAGTQFGLLPNPTHSLFRNLDLMEDVDEEGNPFFGLSFTDVSNYIGLSELYAPFNDDQILATAFGNPDIVAIHGHNLTHNGYLYIPYSNEALAEASTPALLTNAVKVLASSKAPVTKATAPTITMTYGHLATVVTITSGAPNPEIFYTLDGSEPTEASTRYTEPFTLTEALTVRAVVKGDGYLLSDPTEQLVDIRQMAPMPTIALEPGDGQTVVTISSDIEEAKIYYNYKGENTTDKSSPYTGPITLTSGRTVYAFQTLEGFLNSEVAEARVAVKNPHVRVDILSQMDASQETYYPLTNQSASNAGNYFSWANSNSYPYYDPATDEILEDSEGRDSVVHHSLNVEEVVDFGNGWSIRARGQQVSWEGANHAMNYGNSGEPNPATVEDENELLPCTNFIINLNNWDTQYPANAKIQTTQPIAGPFDFTAYIINYNGNGAPRLVVEVATDAEADDAGWKQLGDTLVLSPTRRLYRMFVRSYEEPAPVYVRTRIVNALSRAGFFNIYITNEGEESKKIIEEQNSGIAQTTRADAVPTAIYSLNGVRQQQLARGINIVRYSDGTTKKVLIK